MALGHHGVATEGAPAGLYGYGLAGSRAPAPPRPPNNCFVFAVVYNTWIGGSLGIRRAFERIYGYMLEWMLSMDNLFVLHLLFTSFRTPAVQQRKAVFAGIFCAVVLRPVLFHVVAMLLHACGWGRWPVCAKLIYSGIRAVREDDDDEEMELEDMRAVRALRRLCFDVRVLGDYAEEPHLVTFGKLARWQLSMLLVVVSIIELSDMIFALLNVSATAAQIPDQYVAFSSSILARYGLQATFFVVQSLVGMFELLKYGLAVFLIYIGVELMFVNSSTSPRASLAAASSPPSASGPRWCHIGLPWWLLPEGQVQETLGTCSGRTAP